MLDQPHTPQRREFQPRSGAALVVFSVGALITACMALWFAHYLFGALNGDLSLTNRPRGAEAADVPWPSEPASYWLLIVLWSAACWSSAQACRHCVRYALQLNRARATD